MFVLFLVFRLLYEHSCLWLPVHMYMCSYWVSTNISGKKNLLDHIVCIYIYKNIYKIYICICVYIAQLLIVGTDLQVIFIHFWQEVFEKSSDFTCSQQWVCQSSQSCWWVCSGTPLGFSLYFFDYYMVE